MSSSAGTASHHLSVGMDATRSSSSAMATRTRATGSYSRVLIFFSMMPTAACACMTISYIALHAHSANGKFVDCKQRDRIMVPQCKVCNGTRLWHWLCPARTKGLSTSSLTPSSSAMRARGDTLSCALSCSRIRIFVMACAGSSSHHVVSMLQAPVTAVIRTMALGSRSAVMTLVSCIVSCFSVS